MTNIFLTVSILVLTFLYLKLIKILKGIEYLNKVNHEIKRTFDPRFLLISLTYSILYDYKNVLLMIRRDDPILRKIALLTGFNKHLSGYDKVLSDKLLFILEKNNYSIRTKLIGENTSSRLAVCEIYWINQDNFDDVELKLIYRDTYFLLDKLKNNNEHTEKMV